MANTIAYKVFDKKKFTLYKSGTKKEVADYIKTHGIPKKALYRNVKIGDKHCLYMYFKK